MNLEIRSCKSNELPTVIERLDQEFVLNKQRSLSLSKRFPNTLSVENIEQIRVAVSDGVICGALSIRFFEWVAEKQAWYGAMIGMFWVDSLHRGKGVGSNLLSSAMQFLHEKGVDFGVCCTRIPDFFERAGWLVNDCGLFGEMTNRSDPLYIDTVKCQSVVSVNSDLLERLRSRSFSMHVARCALDYCTVPIPAINVLCFFAQNNDEIDGFAIVGEENGIGYFYEMVAPPVLWNVIWSAVTDRFSRLFVNGHSDDPFAQWLTEKRVVVWRPQNKSMWFRVSDRIKDFSIDTWHVSYFDWI